MMKRILCLLAALLLMGCTALAEPRYPESKGVVTDSAGVLSTSVLSDLRKLDKRLDKAEVPQMVVVTVDFLDGTDVQTYAQTLFERWELDEDEMLLLVCVGEESYALVCGRQVDRLVSPATQQELLATVFHEPFMAQQYDVAVTQFVPAMVQELNKACGESVKTSDLFRKFSNGIFGNWAFSLPGSDKEDEDIPVRVSRSSGFSLLPVILIVGVLFLVFGRRGKKEPKGNPPAQAAQPANGRPQYFKPRQKPQTPQYFKPRNPR